MHVWSLFMRFVVFKTLKYYYFVKFSFLYLLYVVTHPKELGGPKERPVPKCLSDPKYGEHKYARVNGIKIHYVEKGSHDKPLIVFVHGFPEFWYSWRHQLLEFSDRYWCVAFDTRGYGFSDKPEKLSDYSVNILADDIKELVKHLGKEKFTLIGHDWGGMISSYFVDKYSEMLDNFIIMSSGCMPVWSYLVMTEWWQFRRAWYVFLNLNPCIPEKLFALDDFKLFERAMLNKKDPTNRVTEEDVETYKYTFSQKNALTPPVNYYRANFGKNLSISPPSRLPKGLYILGEFDDYLSPSTAPGMMKRYAGMESQILKNGRHFIQQEHPEAVNEILNGFLVRFYDKATKN